MLDLVVFTDGACANNGKRNARAAYAVVWPDYPELDGGHKMAPTEAQTNNRAEYHGLLHALKQADELDESHMRPLKVYTDSELMINSFTKWIPGWKRKGWVKADGKPVANLDLVKEIDALLHTRRVTFHHVEAHTKKTDWASVNNSKVDGLARGALLS